MILSKIDSPLDQLVILVEYSFSKLNFVTELYNVLSQGDNLVVPQLNGVKTLNLPLDIYVILNELYPDFIPVVQNLYLSAESYEIEMNGERILPFLQRVKKLIHFAGLRNLPLEFSLPSTIEDISFKHCDVLMNVLSSPLPNLRVVELIQSLVFHDDFMNLQQLTIDEDILACLKGDSELDTAKRLIVTGIKNSNDLTFLQDNEEITISSYLQIMDYSKCFKKSKKINIKNVSFDVDVDIDIDLSYHSEVEEFTLTGSKVVLKNGLATGLIPTTLKLLHLKNVNGITNLIGFEHLRKISLLNCPNITTLIGLTRVPSIHLSGLVLTSLEGLGENKVVWIESCDEITDFSPLKFVNRVTVVNCKGFTDSSHLDHVSHVTVTSCDGLEDVSGFRNAKSVEVSNCPLIMSVEALKHVKNLKVL